MLTRTYTRPARMIMDGTNDPKDIIHGAAFTTTGSPGFETLFGAQAPVITAGKTMSIPTSTIGMVPGETLTFFFAVQTTWAGNDGLGHFLFENKGTSPDTVEIRKMFYFGHDFLVARIYSSGGGVTNPTYLMSPALNANNWAANVPHIVIVTITEDNAITLTLDGVTWTGRGGMWPAADGLARESTLGATCYFGTNAVGNEPLEGSMLAAIYKESFDYEDIGKINEDLGSGLKATWTQEGTQPVDILSYALVTDGVGNVYTSGAVRPFPPPAPDNIYPSGVWKYDGIEWTNITKNLPLVHLYTMGWYNGYLYAGLDYDPNVRALYTDPDAPAGGVWRYDGIDWTYIGLGNLFNNRGAYSAGTTYHIHDLITYGGASYLVIATTTGNTPPNGDYYLLWTGTSGTYSPTGLAGVPMTFGYDPDQNLLYAGLYQAGCWVWDGATWTDTGLVYDGTTPLWYIPHHDPPHVGEDGIWWAVWPPGKDPPAGPPYPVGTDYAHFDDQPAYPTGTPMYAVIAMCHDANHGLMYAGTNDNGVWVYDGETWTNTGEGWAENEGLYRIIETEEIAYNSVDDKVYFATDLNGVLEYDCSVGDPTGWTQTEPDKGPPYTSSYHFWWIDYNLEYDPANNMVYTAPMNQGVWQYDGTDWKRLSWFPWQSDEVSRRDAGIHDLLLVGSKLYVGTFGGGVWSTDLDKLETVSKPWSNLTDITITGL